MHVAYYVTGHGFGHGIRTCAVCNRFNNDVKITIRTSLPRRLFDEELKREFAFVSGELDCGCIQKDSVTVDIEATARRYMEIDAVNAERLSAHLTWARDSRVDVIVGDITPFAFEVARAAGVPSVGVSNFSWLDIYAPYVSIVPSFRFCVEHIRRQYESADLALALTPQNELQGFRRRENMGIVGRRGRNRSEAIRERLGISRDKGLALIYLGTFGLDAATWERLEELAGWEFLGIHSLPVTARNFHEIDKTAFRYEDLCASVDCVISKLGYGVYSECLLNGTPLVYIGRTDFAEFPVLEGSVREWGHGRRLETGQFLSLDWTDVLDHIRGGRRPSPIPDTAASDCAARIELLARKGA
ncbi:MAG: hypothetical protein GF418_02635 [Chitinivibrionales bacterium]|nr:hypothetical protein [Chitinivibrionales bacterium]MBD3394499.1 hypothetical protein [Chitinivibrionales bacterium]